MTLSDWKDAASIAGTVVAVPGVLFAAYKTWREVQRIGEQRSIDNEKRTREVALTGAQREAELEQRAQEHQLRRSEFTLAQHRRLFDDPDLKLVLLYLDGDQAPLATADLVQAKRKFLTFCEELILLRNSGYISRDVALYMFGYYAFAAHSGRNFKWGIEYDEANWGLFMSFAEEAGSYLEAEAPPDNSKLRL